MRRRRSPLVPVCAALLALVVIVLAAGCSADPPPPRWEELASGSFSGAKTERLDLGAFYLAGDLRVAWTLSGPRDARSTFLLTARRIADEDAAGWNWSEADIRSWAQGFSTRADYGLYIGDFEPGEARLTLTQRIPRGAVGYSGAFTVYTQKFD